MFKIKKIKNYIKNFFPMLQTINIFKFKFTNNTIIYK